MLEFYLQSSTAVDHYCVLIAADFTDQLRMEAIP